jgi:type VI secretion system Hcp family effector
MPSDGYFKIDGIDGSCAEKGFEKFTYVYHIDIHSFFDFNPSSAQKAGDQKWEPIKLVCKLEETAPEWLQKFRKSTAFKAEIRFPVKDKDGSKKPYLVIKMEDCTLVGFRITCPETWLPEHKEVGHLCEIKLACRKFTIEHDKYAESASTSHRKTGDTYDFDNPTG